MTEQPYADEHYCRAHSDIMTEPPPNFGFSRVGIALMIGSVLLSWALATSVILAF